MMILAITMAALMAPTNAVSLLEQSNEAYQQGDYQKALQGYRQLRDDWNVSTPELLYNLGNAHLQLGEVGNAILHYEAALNLNPRFEPARNNLGKALDATKRRLPPPDSRQVDRRLLAVYYPLSPLQSLLGVHACLAAAFVLLVAYHWKLSVRMKWAFRSAIVVAALLFVLTIGANGIRQGTPKLAVTVSSEGPVFFSTSESDQPRFLLYEGDRVLVDRIEGDWLRVHAHGGERGWTRKDNVALVSYIVY